MFSEIFREFDIDLFTGVEEESETFSIGLIEMGNLVNICRIVSVTNFRFILNFSSILKIFTI